MDLINQKLVVRDWPLKMPGDEKFFGYVVAVGVFPHDWSGEHFSYVDFSYQDDYTRFRLPKDLDLINQLLDYLVGNVETVEDTGGVQGKVWVQLTDEGSKVFLP